MNLNTTQIQWNFLSSTLEVSATCSN